MISGSAGKGRRPVEDRRDGELDAVEDSSGGEAAGSREPLYARIIASLASRIRRGELRPGASLPSERALAEMYGVSTITARRAMTELARQGLVERRSGAGTFVRRNAGRKRLVFLILEFKEAPLPDHRMPASSFGELVGGIAQAAWRSNAALGLSYIQDTAELAAWLSEARSDQTCDGVILRTAGDVAAEEIEQLEAAGLPYVLVKRHVPGRTVPCVIADERRAVRLATEHLVALGHQRIGLVVSTQSRTLHEERASGFRDALGEAGLEVDPRLVCDTPDFSIASGEDAARRLLGRPVADRPSALMVAGDTLAIGAYQAAAHWGIAIPQDVSIASVDGIPESSTLRPSLTTVRMSHVEFGIRATDLLLRMLDARWRDQPLPTQVDVIEPQLVLRDSTAPPQSARR